MRSQSRPLLSSYHSTDAFAFLFLLLLLASFLSPCHGQASFVLTVPHNDESCVVIRVPSDAPSVVSGNFDCLDDSLSPNPVSVLLLDSDLNQLYKSKRGLSEDLFELQVNSDSDKKQSRLSLCVQNGIHHKSRDKLDRSVGVNVRVSSIPKAELLQEEGAMLLSFSQSISNKLYDLQNHMDYMRARESAHREVAEQTYTYVVRWTVLEAIVLVCVAAAQILYLRKFFETKRYI
jgi:hypothetical protein